MYGLWIFLLEITKIQQKSGDFWFADFFLEIFKIHRLVWNFLNYLCDFHPYTIDELLPQSIIRT